MVELERLHARRNHSSSLFCNYIHPKQICFGPSQAKKRLDTHSEHRLEFELPMSNYTTILSQKQRWGFAIHRTDYSSEADWTKFLAIFETWPLYGFPSPQLENGRLARLWQQHYWMTGSQFDGTTIDQLRQHFQSWVASQDFGEQRMWPESYMFLVVDKDVLKNIHAQNPELDFLLPRDQPPYVKAIDKDHLDQREEYPGWMKLNLMDLLDVYNRGLDF